MPVDVVVVVDPDELLLDDGLELIEVADEALVVEPVDDDELV
jgi:hypothetical protein